METLGIDIRHRCAARAIAAATAALLALLGTATGAAAQPRFGAWNPGEPYAGSLAGADALERATGRRVEIVNWYQNWGGAPWIADVQPSVVRTVTGSGRTPLLTWEPHDPQLGVDQSLYALARIADGTHDAYIARFARDLRDLGTPIYLRPMHEMNGTWYPWCVGVNGNTAQDFVAAWRHLHDVFAAEGATNVRWVWSPNNFDASPADPLEAMYPGERYVDVLATDAYNWGSARPQFGGWQPFAGIFDGVYARLAALGPQPIWLAEVATAPDGGDKAAWVRDMFERAQSMRRLDAIVWFNERKELDWRADADPTVAAAFAPFAVGAGADGETGASGAATASPGAMTRRRATDGAAALEDGSIATDADRASLLRLAGDRRVRAGRRAGVRWRARSAAGVRRWVVLLDGRRVHSSVAGSRASTRVRRRVRLVGTHRWRVEGRDASGRALLAASRTFRVVPER